MLDHFLELTATQPLLQVLIVILATFVLEDAATVITAIQVHLHTISIPLALISLYVGIVLGDVGLYALGALAAKWPPAQRWITVPSAQAQQAWLSKNLFGVVFISRFIPGTRLPLYTACGFFRAGLSVFTAATLCATLIWTTALFMLSLRVGGALLAHLGAWRWVGVGGFVVVIILMGRLVARTQKHKI
ncbi:VTT domain-containing protein [Acetobacter sp. LMG 32666]|uniref:DedA family protein n=1 Tax=Acetobacter sp. LMG 32666 TaxID=2959295 RepID=UPI0030C87618